MPDLSVNLNADQADIARRGVANEAARMAELIGESAIGAEEGYFRRVEADHARECLRFRADQLMRAVEVLEQLSWSDQEDAEAGRLPAAKTAEVSK